MAAVRRQQSRMAVKFCLLGRLCSESRRSGNDKQPQQINEKETNTATNVGGLVVVARRAECGWVGGRGSSPRGSCCNWIPSILSCPPRLVCGLVSFHAFISVQWDKSQEH